MDTIDKNKMNKRSKEFFAHHTADDIAEATNVTLLFCLKNYGSYYNNNLREMERLISDGLAKLSDGSRKWEPKIYTLSQMLIHAVRSIHSHEMKRNNRHIDIDQAIENGALIFPKGHLHRSPRESYEAEQRLYRIIQYIRDSGDSIVIDVINILIDGDVDYSSNQEIASYMQLPLNEIVNAKKRLKRMVDQFEEAAQS